MTNANTFSHPARQQPGLVGLRPRRGWDLHPGVRSAGRLSAGERAADRARDSLGSWPFAAAAGVLLGVGLVVTVRHDDRVRPVAVLAVVLSAVALVELSLVLMSARRADRIAGELALHNLDADRRTAAGIDELRGEMERLRGELTRLVARVETSSNQVPTRP